MPATVFDGHENAVGQGEVSSVFCLSSLETVYTLTLKTCSHANSCSASPQTNAISEVRGGGTHADPFHGMLAFPGWTFFNSSSKSFRN